MSLSFGAIEAWIFLIASHCASRMKRPVEFDGYNMFLQCVLTLTHASLGSPGIETCASTSVLQMKVSDGAAH
jgi:hypothetical protein